MEGALRGIVGPPPPLPQQQQQQEARGATRLSPRACGCAGGHLDPMTGLLASDTLDGGGLCAAGSAEARGVRLRSMISSQAKPCGVPPVGWPRLCDPGQLARRGRSGDGIKLYCALVVSRRGWIGLSIEAAAQPQADLTRSDCLSGRVCLV